MSVGGGETYYGRDRCLLSNVDCSFANPKHLHILMIKRLTVSNEENNGLVTV